MITPAQEKAFAAVPSTAAPARSESAQAVVAKLSGVPMGTAEQACLAAKLDEHPDVRDGLGDNPAASAKYADMLVLLGDCTRSAVQAPRFAQDLADRFAAANPGKAMPAETVGCLRDGFAELTADEVTGIVQAGLVPSSATPAQRAPIDTILTTCGVTMPPMIPPPA